MPKKKLAQPRIFFGILEFHLSLEFTLAFNQIEKSNRKRKIVKNMISIEIDESTYTYLLQLLNKRYVETDDISEKEQLNKIYKALCFKSETWLSQLNN